MISKQTLIFSTWSLLRNIIFTCSLGLEPFPFLKKRLCEETVEYPAPLFVKKIIQGASYSYETRIVLCLAVFRNDPVSISNINNIFEEIVLHLPGRHPNIFANYEATSPLDQLEKKTDHLTNDIDLSLSCLSTRKDSGISCLGPI